MTIWIIHIYWPLLWRVFNDPPLLAVITRALINMCVKMQKVKTMVTNLHLYIPPCLLMVPSSRQVTTVNRGSASKVPSNPYYSMILWLYLQCNTQRWGIPPFSSPLCSAPSGPISHGPGSPPYIEGYRDAVVNYYNAELSGKVTQLKDSKSFCKGDFRDKKTEAEKLLSPDNFPEPWSWMAQCCIFWWFCLRLSP